MSIGDRDQAQLLKIYSDRFKEFGYSAETLGWMKKRHKLRYKILLEQWDLNQKKILDFGCGFGDMYGYLVDENKKLDYTGVDINEDLVSKGKEIFPKANLIVRDLFKNPIKEAFDFVFSSGVHNNKMEENWSFIEATFETFNEVATQGFALNFLSDKVSYPLDHAYHSDPSKILKLAYNYSNRIILRNDYMPFEFTVFVDKNDKFDQSKTVYSGYEEFV